MASASAAAAMPASAAVTRGGASATAVASTIGTVARRTIARPWLHHRLPHVQLRTRRSRPASVTVGIATSLIRRRTGRRAAPIAATLAAARPFTCRLRMRWRCERPESATIAGFRRARRARAILSGVNGRLSPPLRFPPLISCAEVEPEPAVERSADPLPRSPMLAPAFDPLMRAPACIDDT